MNKDNPSINYGKHLEKMTEKQTIYALGTTFNDVLTLTKDTKPILVIPDELKEDFIQILSKAAAFDMMKSTVNDNRDDLGELFTHDKNH